MTGATRLIEVDEQTAAVLEARAAERGLSVPELVAEMTAFPASPVGLRDDDIAELDRRWAAIEAGEPTVPHEDVVRWLQTWGTPAFKEWLDR
jgi:predicted transcriptional regulator